MATKKPKAVSDKALSADEGVATPRLKLSETGFVGLKMSNGQILQEAQRAFRYPHFIKVIDEIRANPTVGAAWNVYNFWISRKKWCVEADENASEITKERAEIIESMMHDMQDSWANFIQSVIPYLEYGYGIHEIVPYRRLKRNGSKHNDGLVGIKKLAIRNQDTIAKWNFSEDGRNLLSVSQSIANVENSFRYQALKDTDGLIPIPRENYLLFTASGSAGNPQGNSIYKNIYLAFRQLTMLQEQELLTVAKEAKGLMKIEVPAQYLQGTASPDGGVAATAFKSIIDGHNDGTNSGLLVPQQIDPESKLPMFNYGLLESKGTPAVDVEAVIQRLQKNILVALSVDVLALGDSGGSYSLAESKTSILTLAIDARLKEIKEVLDRYLVKYIYDMNGWDSTEMPEFVYEDEDDIDLEVFSAAVQRFAATDMLERDRATYNKIRKSLGIEEKPENEPVNKDELTAGMGGGMTSRSSDGLSNGTTGNGTSKIGGNSKKVDSSIANKEN